MALTGESLTKNGDNRKKSDAFFQNLLSPNNHISVINYNHVAVRSDWGFSRRTVPEHLVYFVKTGVMDARFHDTPSGEEYLRIRGPSLLWAAPGVCHTFSLVEGEPRPLKFNIRFTTSLSDDCFKPVYLVLTKCGHLQPIADLLHDELQRRHPWGAEVLKPYLALLYSHVINTANTSTSIALSIADQRRIQDYYAENFRSWPTVADMANFLNYSPDYFSRLFRRSMGVSVKTWMVQQRIYQGARLLTDSDLTLTEVALELGFKEVYSFSRQFKQVMGKTPRQWRLENQRK